MSNEFKCPNCKGQNTTKLVMRNYQKKYDNELCEIDEYDSEHFAGDFVYCQICHRFWRWNEKTKKVVEVSVDERIKNIWTFVYPLLDVNKYYPEFEEEINKLLKKIIMLEKLD